MEALPEPFVPVSHLRRTFFDDLETSSRIRRGTREDEVYETVQTVTVGVLRERSPAYGEEPTPTPPRRSRSQGHREPSPPVIWDRATTVRRSVHHRLPPPPTPPTTELQPKSRIHATSAILTNGVAGALCGVALRRFTSSAITQVSAGIVVTQMLCLMGYAQVAWGALFKDIASLVLYGAPPTDEEAARNRVYALSRRLVERLTSTVPRRASFFAGVAGGVLFL